MPTLTSTDAEVQALDGLHLYHAQVSNSSMRVRLLLEEKGLAWTSHLLDATRQDNLTDAYLRINPTSLIPALVDTGVVVTESSDILYYLEERFPHPPLAPAEERERAEMREWVDLAASSHPTTLKPWQYHVTGTRTKRPEDMERYRQLQPDRALVAFHQRSLDGFSHAEIADAVQRNHAILARMEGVLKESAWLVGGHYGLADIAWFPNVLLLDLLGFPTGGYPAVLRWLAAVRSRPTARSAIGRSPLRLPGWLLRPIVRLRKTFRG
jgi:glutathione S-transferase